MHTYACVCVNVCNIVHIDNGKILNMYIVITTGSQRVLCTVLLQTL